MGLRINNLMEPIMSHFTLNKMWWGAVALCLTGRAQVMVQDTVLYRFPRCCRGCPATMPKLCRAGRLN